MINITEILSTYKISSVSKIINILYAYACVFIYTCLFFAIVLEVYQFARDAAVAEAWLIAQEPYLMSQELGVSTYFYEYKYEFLIERAI